MKKLGCLIILALMLNGCAFNQIILTKDECSYQIKRVSIRPFSSHSVPQKDADHFRDIFIKKLQKYPKIEIFNSENTADAVISGTLGKLNIIDPKKDLRFTPERPENYENAVSGHKYTTYVRMILTSENKTVWEGSYEKTTDKDVGIFSNIIRAFFTPSEEKIAEEMVKSLVKKIK